MQHPFVSIAPEVQSILQSGGPVVALESTIITHGMPYPQNVETALRVEQMVRDHGATPATCAIFNGKLTAGLDQDQIEMLGKAGASVAKASRRDIAYLVQKGAHGATTVASTMIIAHLSGIRIFATGGIGGVHRGATSSMDISADLQELAQTPVAVVSAGAKSILDIGLTLEYLETMGVPVLGYQTREFPAFFTRKSGFYTEMSLDTPAEVAGLLHTHWGIGMKGGVLIANPVPEDQQMDADQIEASIQAALAEAERQGIKGKETTPFLLASIEALSGGSSLKTNIDLVLNNARLAAEVAKELSGR